MLYLVSPIPFSEELFETARAKETLEVSVVYKAGSSEHHNPSRQ